MSPFSLAAIFVAVAIAAGAADDTVPRIELNNVPLADAIRNLARQSDLNYVLDPHVSGSEFGPGRLAPKLSVTARWTNATAQAALNSLLKEHRMTMVSSPSTTVARIAPADQGVTPVAASRVGTNISRVVPLLVLDSVPLPDALNQIAGAAGLKVSFEPPVSASALGAQGTVSVRWQRITARQALAALLDNYGLVMAEDSENSTARITLKAKDGESEQP